MGRVTDIYSKLMDLELRMTALENRTSTPVELKVTPKKIEKKIEVVNETDDLESELD